MFAALALLVVVASAVEDDARFLEARRLFEAFELDGALARFNLLLLDDELPPDERARVLLWKGLCEAELGRFADATEAFTDAFVADPDAELPIEASPKVLQMLEEARERAARRTPPVVEVATTHDGTVHPSGPGVLIRTTSSGRMDAAVQERPPAPPPAPPVESVPPDEGGDLLPWLIAGGVAAAAVVVAGAAVAVTGLALYGGG